MDVGYGKKVIESIRHDKNANRMMTVASLLEHGIELSFADGAKGLIPYADLPEIGKRAALSTLELPNPYEMVLKTAQGTQVEIPWDFARHYCDTSYRPAVEAIAMRGRHTLGQRIRRFRNAAGLTQDALARAADIGRVTLVRLERVNRRPDSRPLTQLPRPWQYASRNCWSNRNFFTNNGRKRYNTSLVRRDG